MLPRRVKLCCQERVRLTAMPQEKNDLEKTKETGDQDSGPDAGCKELMTRKSAIDEIGMARELFMRFCKNEEAEVRNGDSAAPSRLH